VGNFSIAAQHGLSIPPAPPPQTDAPTLDVQDSGDIMGMLRIILARRLSRASALRLASEEVAKLPPIPAVGGALTGHTGFEVDPEPA